MAPRSHISKLHHFPTTESPRAQRKKTLGKPSKQPELPRTRVVSSRVAPYFLFFSVLSVTLWLHFF